MKEKFEIWRESFEASLEKIAGYLSDTDPGMQRLTRWLMETATNPYDFLMPSDAATFSSADLFAGLLHSIHHALVDDGEISFVAVNGRPMIVFAAHDEIENVELRGDVEREIAERRGTPRSYELLGGVEDFIFRRDRYDEHKQASFALIDARRAGQMSMEDYRARRADLDEAYRQSISRPGELSVSPRVRQAP
ncbi:hypothetical protein O9X98_14940 [Agrobacterium salinitolerans]|nr:hypothetical protein [Agrobacterium salinitolerans]